LHLLILVGREPFFRNEPRALRLHNRIGTHLRRIGSNDVGGSLTPNSPKSRNGDPRSRDGHDDDSPAWPSLWSERFAPGRLVFGALLWSIGFYFGQSLSEWRWRLPLSIVFISAGCILFFGPSW
jgi:hypothetical protein